MAARRRSYVPPYEIMGRHAPASGGAAGTGAARPEQNDPAYADAEPASNAAAEQPAGPWWVGSSTPIILRVPRGLAVVALAGIIGLLVLAYFVGYSVGDSSGAARVQSALADGSSTGPRHQPPAIPGNQAAAGGQGSPQASSAEIGYHGKAGAGAAAGSTAAGQAKAARRKPGLNYLILATYPKDWAKRLQSFLADQGVPAILDRVGTSDKYHVVAVDQGFSASQLDSRRKTEYEAHMHQIGRAWQKYNHGRGDKLETMYFNKYDGK